MTGLSLDRESRIRRHLKDLQRAVDVGDEHLLLDSLAKVFRLIYADQRFPWLKKLNRFDFLTMPAIDPTVNTEWISLTDTKIYRRHVFPNGPQEEDVDFIEFKELQVIRLGSQSVSVQEFIEAIGYNGTFHMEPAGSKDKLHRMIYVEFISMYPGAATILAETIAKVFLKVLNRLLQLLDGGKDMSSDNNSIQPIYMRAGRIQLDGSFFQNSYAQFPIRQKRGHGLRVCLLIRVENRTQQKVLFEYGHRDDARLNMRLSQSAQYLILSIYAKSDKNTLRVPIDDKFDTDLKIECAVYPSGEIILGLNEYLKSSERLHSKISVIDGKGIVGADLKGEQRSELYFKECVVQSIDRQGNLRPTNSYSVKRNLKLVPQRILANEIKRPFPC